jgi:hypothetical protein
MEQKNRGKSIHQEGTSVKLNEDGATITINPKEWAVLVTDRGEVSLYVPKDICRNSETKGHLYVTAIALLVGDGDEAFLNYLEERYDDLYSSLIGDADEEETKN